MFQDAELPEAVLLDERPPPSLMISFRVSWAACAGNGEYLFANSSFEANDVVRRAEHYRRAKAGERKEFLLM